MAGRIDPRDQLAILAGHHDHLAVGALGDALWLFAHRHLPCHAARGQIDGGHGGIVFITDKQQFPIA
jgi:hypothetical protein